MRKVIRSIRPLARRVKHKIKYVRIRQRYILGFLLLCNVVFFLQIATRVLTYPNTYIGSINTGLKTKNQIRRFIESRYRTPIELSVKNHVYTYTYNDLGVYLDTNALVRLVFERNSVPFPGNIPAFFRAFFTRRSVDIPLLFTQNFREFTDKTVYDLSQGPDLIYVDQNTKQLNLFPQEERYRLDPDALQIQLTEHFGRPGVRPQATLISVDMPLRHAVSSANTRLKEVFDDPLTLIFGTEQGDIFLPLSTAELVSATIISADPDTANVTFAIDVSGFRKKVEDTVSAHRIRTDLQLLLSSVGEKIQRSLTDRLAGIHTDSVRFAFDAGPNTDGTQAPRYIEVDISQQKLFTFDGGKLVKTYRVSTGKDYPTPTGRFAVLNKTSLGFSGIYNVWMPYWMGFSYSNKLKAYFGIHELPYFYKDGNKVSRPREFIGSPNTGGCVALDVGEAKEVYAFASVGTPVLVYN